MSDDMILNQLTANKTEISPKTRKKLINLLHVQVKEKLLYETHQMQQQHASLIEINESEKRLKVLEKNSNVKNFNYKLIYAIVTRNSLKSEECNY